MGDGLAGQVAVVTGAGRGLGHAYAIALAAEGAKVVVNDKDREAADAVVIDIERTGGTAVASGEPVGDVASAAAIVRTAVDTFGRLDIMVTNAGADRRGMALDLSPDDWEFTLKTHLLGSLYCSLEAAKTMKNQGEGGVITNVVSDAFYQALPTLAPYCVAKGALYGMTLVLAAELAPLGISVNAIAPPGTRTGPMLDYIDALPGLGMSDEALNDLQASLQEPEDVAPLAVFFATPEGRKLSGRVFTLTADELSVMLPPAQSEPVRPSSGQWTLDELIATAPRMAQEH